MRREAAVRKISREETGSVPIKAVKAEAAPAATLQRSILSTLNDMERMMDEAFHRPFLGFGATPFRHLLQEWGSFGEYTPAVDIFEEKGDVVVKAELPGLKREDINVSIVENNLILSGEKKSEAKVERKDYLRVERSRGSFSRTLSLPEGIDTEHAKASFRDGILEVRLPITGGKGAVRQITVE